MERINSTVEGKSSKLDPRFSKKNSFKHNFSKKVEIETVKIFINKNFRALFQFFLEFAPKQLQF